MGYPLLLFLAAQRLGACGEELLPGSLTQHVVVVVADIDVDGVVAVCTADTIHKWQVHHLGMLAQPPDVGFIACQTGAVDAALLTGANADSLAIFHIANAVALCVFQCDKRNHQVTTSSLGKILVLCGDVFKKGGGVKLYFIATLFKGDAKDLFALKGLRNIVGVYLDDVVGALPLGTQDFHRFGGEVGGYHAIAYLTLQQCGCHCIAGVAQCHKITVATHAVGTTGTGVSTSYGRKFLLDVIYEINLAKSVA